MWRSREVQFPSADTGLSPETVRPVRTDGSPVVTLTVSGKQDK